MYSQFMMNGQKNIKLQRGCRTLEKLWTFVSAC